MPPKYQRLNVGNSKLSIKVQPTPKVSMGCVTVSIPLRVDPFVIRRLKTGETCSFDSNNVDTAIVAYAAYKRAESDLRGNATNVAGHKVGNVTCGCSSDEFLISALCDKSMASLRKNAGTIIKNLKFSMLSTDYRLLCKTLDLKADTVAFDKAANEATSAMKKGIDVAFTGKVNVRKEQLENALDTLKNKIPDTGGRSGGTTRSVASSGKASCKDHWLSVSSGSPMDAVILQGFLEQYVNNSFVCGKNVYYPVQYESKVNNSFDSGKVDRYAAKLDRLGDFIAGVVCFSGASQGFLAPGSMNSGKNYSMSDIKKAIK